MLAQLNLQCGSSPAQPGLSFSPGPMTVFVGPNNSGKSLILREIERSVTQHNGHLEGLIVRPLSLAPMSAERVKPLFRIQAGQTLQATIRDPITGREVSTLLPSFLEQLQSFIDQNNPDSITRHLDHVYATHTLRLDGQTRLNLVREQDSGDLHAVPTNLLQALFQNDEARRKIRDLTHEAFGYYAVIDATRMTYLRLRMSSVKPFGQEKSLSAEAVDFFGAAKLIEEFSDGVKAYTGLVGVTLAAPYLLMLIDEPEAFLHPPLIRRLGRVLCDLAAEREGNVLASTHSSEFLLGCIQSGKGVNVVRLTYMSGIATGRLLPSEKLQTMMRDPFLRSTGVLNALFHNGAVVCEADMDRAFYQEINERLLEAKSAGADSCLFLNANGKDSISRIIAPLREMGIPAAMIVDLDVVTGGLSPLLRAASVPPAVITSLNTLKDKVKGAFESLSLEPKKSGIEALDGPNREAAEILLNNLEEYGIFVVSIGEIEKYLADLSLTGHGPFWLSQAFEKMGTDPTDPTYLRPKAGDVWDFIRKVAKWIANPNRRGIPE